MHPFIQGITARVIAPGVLRLSYSQDTADVPFDFTDGTFGIVQNELDALMSRHGVELSRADFVELFTYIEGCCVDNAD